MWTRPRETVFSNTRKLCPVSSLSPLFSTHWSLVTVLTLVMVLMMSPAWSLVWLMCSMSGPDGDWVQCWPQVRHWLSLSGPGPASRGSHWSRLITWPAPWPRIGCRLLRMARLLRALSSRCHSSARLSLLGAHHNTPHHSINSSTTLFYLHFNCHQSSGLSSDRLAASRNTLHQIQDPASVI